MSTLKSIPFLAFMVVLFVFANQKTTAQNQNRTFTSWKLTENKIEISVSDGLYIIEPYSNQIVHTTFLPSAKAQPNYSYAVCAVPSVFNIETNDQPDILTITMGQLKVKVGKKPFSIDYQFDNHQLISENKGYFVDDTLKAIGLNISNDEILYGGGERVLGLNRRGYKLTLYNKAHYGYGTYSELMNYTLPLFLSSKQYAVLFDNASSGFLDLDSQKNNSVVYSAVNGTMNYYVVAGKSWLDLIDQYTWLTGRQPMPPIWAFGNFSSRFGYHSQREVMQTIQKFKDQQIPVDAVIIDIYWFGPGIFDSMGNLNWFTDSFPEPQKMIADLKQMGVKTVLVSEPFILTTSSRWDEAVNAGAICNGPDGKPYSYHFYFGNTGLIDIFKPEARSWFWNIYKDFTQQGVAGWWGDLGEPELHPYQVQHINGSANDVHNAYGHSWAQLIYEGFRKDFPEKRPFILMRSGYAGSQRYGIIPWTGDVSRGWEGLVSQPELALSMAMQGIAYTHSDLGGFAGGDSLDNELYTRWLQYGVFQPVFRPHAQEQIPSEPVFQKPATMQLAKEAIELRYQLLPYNYSLAFENHRSGKPFMMPLFFIEPDNKKLATYDAGYLWGDNFLVHPVKQRGLKEATIYLPTGSNWYDYFTGNNYTGGKEISYNLTIDHIPVFVKEGAIVPMAVKMENTEAFDPNQLVINYWYNPKGKSSFNLYLDDGLSANAYENEDAEIVHIETIGTSKGISINLSKETGAKYQNAIKQTRFLIHALDKAPARISAKNRLLEIEQRWDPDNHLLEITLKQISKQEIIEMEF
jgi:alpha-glucosidase/oligosaccharide 4-alpha-D-glucosyltransferase